MVWLTANMFSLGPYYHYQARYRAVARVALTLIKREDVSNPGG